MTLFYSMSANGFFDNNVHSTLPQDAVEISAEEHASLYSGMLQGKTLSGDNNGRPKLSDPDPVPTYRNLADARLVMSAWIDGIMAKIAGQVPEFERASWPPKAAAARAVLADTASADQTALITGEANERGKTVTEMATTITAKATKYEGVIARVAGLRGKLDDELEAETNSLEYEAILGRGKARAAEIATELNVTIS